MIRFVLIGLAGGTAFAAVYVVGSPDRAAPSRQTPAYASAPVRAATPKSLADPLPDRSVRDVTPALLTAAPVMAGPLVRVDPVVRAETPTPKKRQARTERLALPIVEAAGIFQAGSRRVRLAGVEAPPVDATCGGVAAWPCGRMAKAALQRFIRGRSIECAVPAGSAALPKETDCAVGGADIARWLVAEGWAKPAGRFSEEGEAARRAGKGLWSETRPAIGARRTAQAAPASSPESALDMSLRVSSMP